MLSAAATDGQAHFSWQLAVYAILVAAAVYYLCVA